MLVFLFASRDRRVTRDCICMLLPFANREHCDRGNRLPAGSQGFVGILSSHYNGGCCSRDYVAMFRTVLQGLTAPAAR